MKAICLFLAAAFAGAIGSSTMAADEPIARAQPVVSLVLSELDSLLPKFRQPARSEFESLTDATGWLNSRPLSAADLRGKVVVVDFWTYSCINWMRTRPYLREW